MLLLVVYYVGFYTPYDSPPPEYIIQCNDNYLIFKYRYKDMRKHGGPSWNHYMTRDNAIHAAWKDHHREQWEDECN